MEAADIRTVSDIMSQYKNMLNPNISDKRFISPRNFASPDEYYEFHSTLLQLQFSPNNRQLYQQLHSSV